MVGLPNIQQKKLNIFLQLIMIMPMQTQSQRNQRGQPEDKYLKEPMRAQSKNKQTAEARENAGDQLASGCGYSSDWLRRLHELSRPIYDKCFFCDKRKRMRRR